MFDIIWLFIGDQGKIWAPHQICKKCCISLNNWPNKRYSCLPFAAPMIWLKPKHHFLDCYFCLTKTKGFSLKQRDKIANPNLDSAKTPAPHDQSMPPLVPSKDGLDAIGCSANKDNSDRFISVNSTGSEYNTIVDPSYFHKDI